MIQQAFAKSDNLSFDAPNERTRETSNWRNRLQSAGNRCLFRLAGCNDYNVFSECVNYLETPLTLQTSHQRTSPVRSGAMFSKRKGRLQLGPPQGNDATSPSSPNQRFCPTEGAVPSWRSRRQKATRRCLGSAPPKDLCVPAYAGRKRRPPDHPANAPTRVKAPSLCRLAASPKICSPQRPE